MADFTIKQGDVSPLLLDTLTYSDGTAVNLTGHTVNFVMRAMTANDVTTNLTATLGNSTTAASIGGVSYTFTTTDTDAPGVYAANWYDATLGMTFPTVGYLTIEIQPNITTPGGATIVGLGELKDYLNIPAATHNHDAKLLRFIESVTPIVENLTGPVIQRVYTDEVYDGGNYFIEVRHRPIINVQNVTEYRGSIAYILTQVGTPDQGTIYSYMFDPPGRIVRRTVGGGITTFPQGLEAVYVTYTAGYETVPENIRAGTLELLRVNYQQTQQAGRRSFGGGPAATMDDAPSDPPTGFFVPNRVREMLAPNRRAPSLA